MITGMTSFSLADLCALADVTPRTVRYYIAQGLLRPASGAGPGARYDDGHLYRLRLIRRLQRDHLPLVEIRRRLDALTDDEVERLASEPAPVTDSASDYIARQLGSRGIRAGVPSPGVPVADIPPLGPHGLPTPRIGPASRPADPEDPPTTPEPTRSQWERIVLAPEIELHIRRPLGRDQNRRVDRLLESARAILEEDPR